MTRLFQRVARRYFASTIPWGAHLASALVHLGSGISSSLGRAVYAEFLAQGVQGLVWGEPISGARDAHRLPPSTGKEFGASAYRLLLAKFGDVGLAEDAVQGFLARILQRGLKLAPGTPLRQAEAYVLRALLNEARDILRKYPSDRYRGLDDYSLVNLDDPAAFARLEQSVPRTQIAAILRALALVNPRAADYVRLLLDGYTPAEVAREWGVSAPYVSKWVRRYGPEIQKAVRRHVEARGRRAQHTSGASQEW